MIDQLKQLFGDQYTKSPASSTLVTSSRKEGNRSEESTLVKSISATNTEPIKTYFDKIPEPSYFKKGLVLQCYYLTEYDYYIAWHKETGLRVLSGRYAAQQNKPIVNNGKKSLGLDFYVLGADNRHIPLHLYSLARYSSGIFEGSPLLRTKFETREVSEAEFKTILTAKPDYKKVLTTFKAVEGYQNTMTNQTLRFDARIILDLENVTRIW